MRRFATTLALLAVCAAPALAANQVRISQVYGGGGGASGTYIRDYVEIYNSGVTPVNISGWVLEYGSATGTWSGSPPSTNFFTFPQATIIQPCQYMLLEAGTPGSGGAALPVTPDFQTSTTVFSMAAGSGKVALFTALNQNVACGSELPGTLVDKVAYGTATCAEVTAVGLLSNTQGAVRNAAGATDTDNNVNDFTIVGAPVPRNSSSFNPTCLATPAKSSTWGQVKSIYR